jgi:hypothetical protein
MRRWVAAVAVAAAMTVPSPAAAEPGPLFRPGEDVDYQLGGVWDDVPDDVGIVVRDRKAAPLEGRYNVCYVNGFQTQPDEKRFWRNHWRLVLKDAAGRSSTRPGASGCSTSAPPTSGRRWPRSSAGGPSAVRTTGSTRSSTTTSTPSPAATG